MGYCNDSDGESFQGREFTTPLTRNDILVCATHGKIYAVHKGTGARIWRSDFPKGSSSLFAVGSMGGIVSIFITDQDDLIIASSGKTACLDLYTGAEKWVNKMKGLGHEEVGITCTTSHVLNPQNNGSSRPHSGYGAAPPPSGYPPYGGYPPPSSTIYPPQGVYPPLQHPPYPQQGGYAPPNEYSPYQHPGSGPPEYYDHSQHTMAQRQVLILGTGGHVLAIDAKNGLELWRFDCPRGGSKIPSTLVDPQGTLVYVGCGTRLYCLDVMNGNLKWKVKVSNSMSGLDYMTMATVWSSRLAAEAHTSFNQCPSAQIESVARMSQAAEAAGGA
ncbi:quinon protein alcohol dehydrogenase-like superfamily [Circinella umbellata]|nr:quinon protein alcohol dehydrogenase-like superfamily [Circinella umbellata]